MRRLPPDWPALDMQSVHRRLCGEGGAFETRRIEIDGRPCTVYRDAPVSLREVLEHSRSFGGRTCLVFEDERIDFRAHARAVARLAEVLVTRHGLRPGDRVVLVMRNFPEWSIVFWAVTTIGAVVVPLNAWLAAEELRRLIDRSRARVVFLDAERHERLGHPTASSIAARALYVVRATQRAPGATRIEEILGAPETWACLPEAALPAARIAPEDPACILYTSGTTGRPLAARASHRNILSNLLSRRFGPARAALRRGAAPTPPAPSVLLAPVPLFHVTGCYSYLVPAFANGDTLVLMHRWSAERALALMEREGVTAMGGVPTMALQLLSSPALDPGRLRHLSSISVGGGASGAGLLDRVSEHLPWVSTGNGYGMTETCSLIAQNTAEDHLARPASVGVAVPVCETRIVDPNGRDLPPARTGELWVRGANVIRGYWEDARADTDRFVDGWLRTGDLVRADDEGFLEVVDRLKDLVIRGGENVACVEVEDALLAHPEVLEGAVFGLPHPELGESVAAWVRVRPGSTLDARALREALAGRLAAFKVPAQMWVDAAPLPQNAAGKVMKGVLRARAHALIRGDGEEAWDPGSSTTG